MLSDQYQEEVAKAEEKRNTAMSAADCKIDAEIRHAKRVLEYAETHRQSQHDEARRAYAFDIVIAKVTERDRQRALFGPEHRVVEFSEVAV